MISKADQADLDRDGMGDVCDTDGDSRVACRIDANGSVNSAFGGATFNSTARNAAGQDSQTFTNSGATNISFSANDDAVVKCTVDRQVATIEGTGEAFSPSRGGATVAYTITINDKALGERYQLQTNGPGAFFDRDTGLQTVNGGDVDIG